MLRAGSSLESLNFQTEPRNVSLPGQGVVTGVLSRDILHLPETRVLEHSAEYREREQHLVISSASETFRACGLLRPGAISIDRALNCPEMVSFSGCAVDQSTSKRISIGCMDPQCSSHPEDSRPFANGFSKKRRRHMLDHVDTEQLVGPPAWNRHGAPGYKKVQRSRIRIYIHVDVSGPRA
jgi:hypothetical protein